MRLLLDTHVWLWMVTSPERLSHEAAEVLRDERNELLLSAASVWEMAIKYRLGKLPLPEPPSRWVPPRLVRDNVQSLPVEHHHAAHVADLPIQHRDPFDRLLIAQARLEKLKLVTADPLLAQYDVELLRT